MATLTHANGKTKKTAEPPAIIGVDESPVVEKGTRLEGVLQITAPRFRMVTMRIVGTAPLVMHHFSQKAQTIIEDTQKEGTRSTGKKIRKPKDFDALYEGAKHVSREGWIGIPAAAFRNASVSACRLVDFKMTLAKMTLFIKADGYDRENGQPLVRITKGEPQPSRMAVRNSNGVVDIRCRPIWHEWEAVVRVRYDSDRYSAQDVINLMDRVGQQVGLLEGRPDSPNSTGMEWGLFQIAEVIRQEEVRR